jgi:heptosyltransferase-2
MPLDEVLELARELHAACDGEVTFLVLGGPDEAPRNARILAGLAALAPPVAAIDARTDNGLERFAALIGLCDLLVVSDSLALHVALARRVPVVAFFAPTSAAEIELYGAGEKVLSTAPDYCSYRRDADNSSITAARVGAAARRVLGLD